MYVYKNELNESLYSTDLSYLNLHTAVICRLGKRQFSSLAIFMLERFSPKIFQASSHDRHLGSATPQVVIFRHST